MDKNEKISKYKEILDALQHLKTSVITDQTAELMISGSLSQDAQKELKILSGITGSIFSALSALNIPITEDEERPGVVSATISGSVYSCAKKSLENLLELSKGQLSASEAMVSVMPTVMEDDNISETEEEEDEETESDVSEAEDEPEEAEPTVKDDEEDDLDLDEEDGVEDEDDEDDLPFSDDDEDDNDIFVTKGATVIGGSKVAGGNRMFFLDEKEKDHSTFVYSLIKLSAMHMDEGRPQEIIAMVAPLNIIHNESSNIPIVVAFYAAGKWVVHSSYEKEKEGKNVVNISISGFEFLVRGGYDRNGNFIPSIMTTGESAKYGDTLSIINQKNYGSTEVRDVKNGHIKFHADTGIGQGYIEVFPFGRPGENDFVVIVKNEEFSDHYFKTDMIKGNPGVVYYDTEDTPYEVICEWDGDILRADIECRRK